MKTQPTATVLSAMHLCMCVWDTMIQTGERHNFHGSAEVVKTLGEDKKASSNSLAVIGCEEEEAKAGGPLDCH